MKKKILFVLITIILLGIIAPSAYCQETEKTSYRGTGKGEAMLFDLIFLRPLGIASCAIGLAGTIVSLPLTIPNDNTQEAVEAFLTEPGNYTFIRPLGQVD
jgi:hypothetical protein